MKNTNDELKKILNRLVDYQDQKIDKIRALPMNRYSSNALLDLSIFTAKVNFLRIKES